MELTNALQTYVESLKSEIEKIDVGRQEVLSEVSKYILEASNPKLNFICTHNSRRSHLSQIWAAVAGYYYDVQVQTFSGGTEATAFHPNAVAALKRAGFVISSNEQTNPHYKVVFSDSEQPLVCYSKTYDDSVNPSEDFAAIMTCSEADADCPIVYGADKKIKLFYIDPKVSDNTPEQDETYDQRCKQIAYEMFYIFSKIR